MFIYAMLIYYFISIITIPMWYIGWSYTTNQKLKYTIKFLWYDFWVGSFYDRKPKVLYVNPLPMVVIRISPILPEVKKPTRIW